MSMYHQQRGMGGPPANVARLTELLDQVKAEFDTQLRASESLEHQISVQVNEMQLVREKVYAMEQTHMTLKQKYEEEINMLRHQLEVARKGAPGPIAGPHQHPGQPQQPPAIASGNGLFSGIMGGNQSGLAPPQPHAPPPEQQMGPQHQMAPGPPGPGLPAPPHPNAQQPPYQQPYGQQGPPPNGMGPQAPPSTASPGPGRRGIGRPPNAVGGPATPQINTPVPYPGNAAQSPQVSHPTPDHGRLGGPRAPPVGNALGDLEIENVPAHNKKQGNDWHAIFNPGVQRVLDVDLVHSLSHDSVVCCVRFSYDGKYVATGCNRSAQIFDVQTGEKVCVLEDHTAHDGTADLYIRSVCFSPDGRYLATGAEDKLIRVWDIQTRTIRNHFSGHDQDIYSLDFARDGRTIASGSGDRTVRLWDIEQGTNSLTLTIEDGVTTVAISPDTKYVAAGSLDKSVRVWDIHTGYLVERLEGAEGHKDSVYSVAFSPSGHDLVSGSLDRTIKMWELGAPRNGANPNQGHKGKCVKTFEGHRDFVLSVALTPDSNWVLSGSKDRGVQFWDPRTGTTQLMLQGHRNSVISVAPSPQGTYFATGSGDQKARIWSYRPI